MISRAPLLATLLMTTLEFPVHAHGLVPQGLLLERRLHPGRFFRHQRARGASRRPPGEASGTRSRPYLWRFIDVAQSSLRTKLGPKPKYGLRP
jgi:hypothetical protein